MSKTEIRHPSEILGAIRHRTESIIARKISMTAAVDALYDAERISELLAELEQSQTIRDLQASKLLVALKHLCESAEAQIVNGDSPEIGTDIRNADEIIAEVEGGRE